MTIETYPLSYARAHWHFIGAHDTITRERPRVGPARGDSAPTTANAHREARLIRIAERQVHRRPVYARGEGEESEDGERAAKHGSHR